VAASTLLPWHRSGRARRDAFALARVADELGLVTGILRQALFVGIFLLPLLAACTFVAAVAGARRVAAACACAAGVVGLSSAAVVLRQPGGRQAGPAVAIAAAVTAVGCSLCLVLSGKASHG
jgi:hypothetical protein